MEKSFKKYLKNVELQNKIDNSKWFWSWLKIEFE
jgi:hypothetical protein